MCGSKMKENSYLWPSTTDF